MLSGTHYAQNYASIIGWSLHNILVGIAAIIPTNVTSFQLHLLLLTTACSIVYVVVSIAIVTLFTALK